MALRVIKNAVGWFRDNMKKTMKAGVLVILYTLET